jgi:hypothetical protein
MPKNDGIEYTPQTVSVRSDIPVPGGRRVAMIAA